MVMDFVKRNVGFLLLLLAAAGLSAYLGYSWKCGVAQAKEFQDKVEEQRKFFQRLSGGSVSVTEENLTVAKANRQAAADAYKRLVLLLAERSKIPAESASGFECKRIINEECRKLKLDLGKRVKAPADSPYFTFDSIANSPSVPTPADVPLILKQLHLVGELVRLVSVSGVVELRKLVRQQGLKGIDRDPYVIYPVEMVVDGSFESVQKLVNSLHQESKNIMTVRSVNLEAREVLSQGAQTLAANASAASARTPTAMKKTAAGVIPAKTGTETTPDDAANSSDQPIYLPPVVTATILVDVIEFKKPAEEK